MYGQGGWHNAGAPLRDVRRAFRSGMEREKARRLILERYGGTLTASRVANLLVAGGYERVRINGARTQMIRASAGLQMYTTQAPPELRPCTTTRDELATRPQGQDGRAEETAKPLRSCVRRSRSAPTAPHLRSREPSPPPRPAKRVTFELPSDGKRRRGVIGILINPDPDKRAVPVSSDPTPPAEDGFEMGCAGGRLLPPYPFPRPWEG